MPGRACPKCASPYTVGPQTYNPTNGGFNGSNNSFFRLSVLYIVNLFSIILKYYIDMIQQKYEFYN